MYGLVQVGSPALPLIALVGLLGMVLDEGTIGLARYNFHTPAQELTRPASDNVRAPRSHHSGSSEPTAII
jgi:xanthosine utilization system XapX-like protein